MIQALLYEGEVIVEAVALVETVAEVVVELVSRPMPQPCRRSWRMPWPWGRLPQRSCPQLTPCRRRERPWPWPETVAEAVVESVSRPLRRP